MVEARLIYNSLCMSVSKSYFSFCLSVMRQTNINHISFKGFVIFIEFLDINSLPLSITEHLLYNSLCPLVNFIIFFMLCYLCMLHPCKKRSFSIIKVGPYVRPERLAVSVNLDRLELSYCFQTLHDDS